MLPDDLTTFLAIYAHPAAVIARGAVQFENAPFRASREACGDLLLEKLCAAVAASSRRAVTRFHAAGAASGTIVWSLTHQRDLRDPELRRTVVLAQDTLIGGEEAASGHLDPERPLRGDRWWLAEPRFKGISTGGGVMGDMIRSWDWGSTHLGPMHTWSHALITTVGMILQNDLATCIYWGPQLVIVYNTAFISILSPVKHNAPALGLPCHEVWGEIWEDVGPSMAATLQGKPYSRKEHRLFIHRLMDDGHHHLEEVYVTWALIPVYESDGNVGGMLTYIFEESRRVISERRMQAMRDLNRLSSARTLRELWAATCDALSQLEFDLPYAAAYSLNSDIYNSRGVSQPVYTTFAHPENIPLAIDHVFVLHETIGCPAGCTMAPLQIVVGPDGEDSGGPWPLAQLCATKEVVVVEGVGALLDGLPERGFPGMRPTRAAVLPLLHGDAVVGCLVLFLNAALPYDDDFRRFIEVLSRQISTSAAMMFSYEGEVQKNEELAALDRAKTAFFTSECASSSDISHELRAPLTLILGPAAELREAQLSNSLHGHVLIIDRNARRLLRLVNSILDFAAAEAGRMSATFQPTEIGPFVQDLASAFRSAAEAAGLEYTIYCSLPDHFVVWVDQDKIEKIVYNLLGNALKFTEQGFIRIELNVESGLFVLSVQDSGVGIPNSDLGKIFEKFHRVENVFGRSIEGTGIGLSLTLELAKMHKGTIHVESTVGKGSKFQVVLPLGSDHLPAESIVNESQGVRPRNALLEDTVSVIDDAARWGQTNSNDGTSESNQVSDVLWEPLLFGSRQRARILVVDDNADMRKYIMSLLSKFCDLDEVVDGFAALEKLKTQTYDIVLSDVMMPRVSGGELLDAIRADPALKNMPFIMLSARAGEEARLEGLARGADDYLAKPFSAKELLLRTHTQLQTAVLRSELETRVEERTRALEHSRESFKGLSERLSVAVHRANAEGKITWANQRWIDTLHLDPATINDWGYRIHPDDRERAVNAYMQAIATRCGYAQPIELRLIEPDGLMDVIYDLQPEFTSDSLIEDDLLGWVGVFSDVSNLRRLERENLAAQRARAEEADHNRMLHERFLDITCHELRNPLNAIYNSAELLGESLQRVHGMINALREMTKVPLPSSPAAVNVQPEWDAIEAELQEDMDGVKTIILCAQHQKRIADVLNVSKLSANLVTLTMSDFRPYHELSNVIRMFRDESAARGIQLQFDKDESWDRQQVEVVRGDSGRFTQIVVNLLSNAIKFTESAARRDVRVLIGASPVPVDGSEDGSSLVPASGTPDLLPMCRQAHGTSDSPVLRLFVAVADSGHGMTEDEQQRIFQRFAQASPRTYGEFGGSGLGLYISRNLVHLHGGEIHLQSQKDVGTIVRFYITVERSVDLPPIERQQSPRIWNLPLAPSIGRASDNGQPMTVGDTVPHSRQLRVLIVEDNLINQKILVKLLRNLGCETFISCDGQDCLNLLIKHAKIDPLERCFDLILMDLEMPILEGMEATRRIRQMEAENVLPGIIPIVAVSGNARPEYAKRAADAGMNGFIRKPYGKAELVELIETLLSAGQV